MGCFGCQIHSPCGCHQRAFLPLDDLLVSGEDDLGMMKFDARQYFASLVELSCDTGLIGQILRRYPEWMLRAADKWAEQTYDHRKQHEEPNRPPLPDPW